VASVPKVIVADFASLLSRRSAIATGEPSEEQHEDAGLGARSDVAESSMR
jgi:hypothetical protein